MWSTTESSERMARVIFLRILSSVTVMPISVAMGWVRNADPMERKCWFGQHAACVLHNENLCWAPMIRSSCSKVCAKISLRECPFEIGLWSLHAVMTSKVRALLLSEVAGRNALRQISCPSNSFCLYGGQLIHRQTSTIAMLHSHEVNQNSLPKNIP